MSVVLISPPTTGHTITQTVDHFLQEDVEFDVGGEGPVASFVHQPTTASLEHTEDSEAGEGVTDLEHVETSEEEDDDLGDAVDGVDGRPVEPAFLVEAAGHFSEVLGHGFVLAELVGFFGGFDFLRRSRALRESSEHLLGLFRADVELFIGISSITTFSEELDDGATRMFEVIGIVEITVNENFILSTRSTSSSNGSRHFIIYFIYSKKRLLICY